MKCSYVIFPSCSEGGAPSFYTAIGNGGLIPIITKETSVVTRNEIWIKSYGYAGIDQAVTFSQNLGDKRDKKLKAWQVKNLEYVLANHNQEKYYEQLKINIRKILNLYEL